MFFDPGWKVLWLQDDSDTVYLDSGRASLPLKAGQEVEIQGVTPPKGGGLIWDRCTFKVLRESALPPPSTLTVPVAEFEGHSVQRATVEGYARMQIHGSRRLSFAVRLRTASAGRFVPDRAVGLHFDCGRRDLARKRFAQTPTS
ncbi:MAG: hypothetical protein AAB676_20905 [Verrucomicrobiota bacterium]